MRIRDIARSYSFRQDKIGLLNIQSAQFFSKKVKKYRITKLMNISDKQAVLKYESLDSLLVMAVE